MGRFERTYQKLYDATFMTESNMWQDAMTIYSVLRRVSVTNPTLAQGLQPVQAFFQTKKTKGNERAKAAQRNAIAANKVARKYLPPASSTAATSDGSSPAVASTHSASAAAATPASTSGVARS